MEPYATYNSGPAQNRQLLMLLNVLIVLAILLSVLFVFLDAAGYGTVRLTGIPSDATVRINGHIITASSLRLRAGDYGIEVTSPRISPSQSTLHVHLLRTIVYQPAIGRRNPDAIASSTIGAVNGSLHAPRLTQTQWFDSDTWLVGRLSTSGDVLALQYDTSHKQWSVGFYATTGYPQDTTKLPATVAAYVARVGGI